ncbi:MAG: hypothetical protein ACE15D_13945 [Candidatus Eisenbacteria bacterium]
MTEICPPVESLERIDRLPASDPARAHFEGCPRCRARWRSLQLFLDPAAAVPEGAEPREAAERLSRAIRREAGLPVTESLRGWTDGDAEQGREAGRRGRSGPPEPPGPPGPLGRLARLLVPAFRPALAAGAALLVIGIFLELGGGSLLQPRSPAPPATPALRGEPGDSSTPAPSFERIAGGSVRVAWRSVRGADSYRILFYGDSLAETAWPATTADTSLVLDPARLARLGVSGATVFCRVAALSGGDLLRVSPPAALVLP